MTEVRNVMATRGKPKEGRLVWVTCPFCNKQHQHTFDKERDDVMVMSQRQATCFKGEYSIYVAHLQV